VTLEVGDRDLKNFHQWVYPIISKLAEEADWMTLVNVLHNADQRSRVCHA
jgi:hypothetical protein